MLYLKSGFYNILTFRILSSKTYKPMEILDPEMNFIFSIKESNWKKVFFYFFNFSFIINNNLI